MQIPPGVDGGRTGVTPADGTRALVTERSPSWTGRTDTESMTEPSKPPLDAFREHEHGQDEDDPVDGQRQVTLHRRPEAEMVGKPIREPWYVYEGDRSPD